MFYVDPHIELKFSKLQTKSGALKTKFSIYFYYAAHMRVHKNNGKADKASEVNSIVKEEYPTIEEKLQWVCNICNTEFSSLKSLK